MKCQTYNFRHIRKQLFYKALTYVAKSNSTYSALFLTIVLSLDGLRVPVLILAVVGSLITLMPKGMLIIFFSYKNQITLLFLLSLLFHTYLAQPSL